jgi:hypothetical protein
MLSLVQVSRRIMSAEQELELVQARIEFLINVMEELEENLAVKQDEYNDAISEKIRLKRILGVSSENNS